MKSSICTIEVAYIKHCQSTISNTLAIITPATKIEFVQIPSLPVSCKEFLQSKKHISQPAALATHFSCRASHSVTGYRFFTSHNISCSDAPPLPTQPFHSLSYLSISCLFNFTAVDLHFNSATSSLYLRLFSGCPLIRSRRSSLLTDLPRFTILKS